MPLDSGNPKVLAFARQTKVGGVLVLLNMSDAPQQAHISGWPAGTPVMGNVLLASATSSTASLLEPFGVRILNYAPH